MGGAVVMGSWSRGATLRAKFRLSARPVPQGSIAKSGSKGSTLSVDKIFQDEVVATIPMGKALRIYFKGKEDEVIIKLKDMEVKDKERAAPRVAEAQS